MIDNLPQDIKPHMLHFCPKCGEPKLRFLRELIKIRDLVWEYVCEHCYHKFQMKEIP